MSVTSVSPAVAMARLAHLEPGLSRAVAARSLGMGSGVAAETATRLVSARVLDEAPAPPNGRRGRPTTSLLPHPAGPLVAVASITHETWQVCAVQLGGGVVASTTRPHRRALPAIRRAVGARLAELQDRFGPRIGAYVVSVPGTVTGTRLVQAPVLGWKDVELVRLRPRTASDAVVVGVGNDATLAGVAESRRGAAAGAASSLHLYLDAGIGGAHLLAGRPVLGATGTAGEFGHMPFGDPTIRCPCGAQGCWSTSLDGTAVASLLHQAPPPDQVGYVIEVMAAAQGGNRPAMGAVRVVARRLGRGAAGLVNALDPEIVTVGGIGRRLLHLAGDEAQEGYREGLMSFRSSAPPPLVAGSFGDGGPVVGAADEGFDWILTDDGIRRWAAAQGVTA